ncbi:hypothetical protein E3N88_42041 [Mikania micrantha]|uniref:PRA1 family protein n=1 Tax=Mikania micrantha TaxID=192012 RepID=A0A5N6LIU8_9ASTR|nr:hypothetical protein E3N88_42041 [Mikania micrantha]
MSKNSTASGYGTLPTSTATGDILQLPSTPNTMIARARHQTEDFISRRRPWREFFDYKAVTWPLTYADTMSRIKQNLNYFRVNYAMMILLVLPVVIFGYVFDDRVVLMALSLLTVFALACTDVGVILLAAIGVGAVVVVVHAGIRNTDDLFLDEPDVVDGGLVSVVGDK